MRPTGPRQVRDLRSLPRQRVWRGKYHIDDIDTGRGGIRGGHHYHYS